MPFGVINVGAIFQKMMGVVFSPQIGRNMKVYVDDMIVKTKRRDNHDQDLRESFENIKKHKVRLNLSKCFFEVGFGKFLGFILTQRVTVSRSTSHGLKQSKRSSSYPP